MTFDLTCDGCGAVLPCEGIPDDQLYSLQNPTFPFIFECIDNNCQVGPIIYFSCCDRLLQAPVPVGSSSGQIQSILNSLAAQCFNLQSACGELPPFPPGGFTPSHPITLFFNQSQTCKLICPDGNPFTYTVPAGWVAAITQAKANATAYSLACARAKAARFCLSDIKTSPACGVAYSVTITASGPIVTPCTWTVVNGALPAGLTLGGFSPNIDTTLGPIETIQGTPTTGGPFSFTLRCEGSDGVFMQKAYSGVVSGTCCVCPTNATINFPGGFDAAFNQAGPCQFTAPGSGYSGLLQSLDCNSSNVIAGEIFGAAGIILECFPNFSPCRPPWKLEFSNPNGDIWTGVNNTNCVLGVYHKVSGCNPIASLTIS